jgi:hypothetical protein
MRSPVAQAFGMYLVRDLAKLRLGPGEVYWHTATR